MLLFHQLNVSLRQVVKRGEESGQTPEETADGKGLGTFEEMKEAWGEMGSPTDPIRLTFRSDWWFWVVSAPDCFLPSCQSPSLSSQVSLSII